MPGDLRGYQRRAVDAVARALGDGARCPIVVAPTGAGKTVIAAAIAARLGGRALVVVPRVCLVEQTLARLAAWGVTGAEVATVQGLQRSGRRPAADVVIADEAHHYVSDTWGPVLAGYREAGVPLVGLTATPCRGDGRALGALADRLIVAASVAELTAAGHLVPARVLAPPQRQRGMAEDPVAAVRRLCAGRPTVVAARDVAHAEAIAAELGPRAAAVHGSMSRAEVDARLAAYEAGELDVLASVHVLSEGWDSPRTSAVVLARGVGHAGTYLQIVGRALRPSAGKADALVVDLCGAAREHGHPAAERVYSLDGDPIRAADGTPPLRQCGQCGAVWWAAEGRVCPGCGASAPLPEPPEVRRARLAEVSARHTPDERRAYQAQLEAQARARGYRRGWVMYRMRARYG